MAKNPRLSDTVDIEISDTDFKNQNWRDAAEDILDFYRDGVRSFVEMEDLGEWSRSMYQNVYHAHFRAITDNDTGDTITGDVLDKIEMSDGEAAEVGDLAYREGFKDGFSAGARWALENQELLQRRH